MNRKKFKALLQEHIAPMFSGCTVETAPPAKNASKLRATLEGNQHIKVRWSPGKSSQFYLRRTHYFSQQDAKFVNRVIREINKLSKIESTPYFDEMIGAAIRRAVASQSASRCTTLTNHILRELERWSEETYEGRPISAVFGIVPDASSSGGVDLKALLATSFGKVVTSSLGTIATVSGNGSFLGYETIPHCPVHNEIRAPLRFTSLAQWANNGNVCVALTRNGEILVFFNGELGFARRRGIWRHFNHKALITRIGSRNAFSKALSTAVYLSCLDVSFAKVGGCIGLVRGVMLKKLHGDDRIDANDRCDGTSEKAIFLKQTVTTKKFQELERPLRQTLLGIDGSTVLERDGSVVAVGAIIKVEAGSKTGGGRKAAAMAFGEYGIGIKVSSDGEIVGFDQEGQDQEPLFTFG